MDRPLFWGVLLVVALVAVGARVLARRPLLPHQAKPLRAWEASVAAVSLLALVFHCLAMFFAGWIDLVPFLRAPAAAVRAMGTASQLAYWVPGVVLVIAVRRVQPLALAVLFVTMIGVGVTMYRGFALTTHLAWLAAAVASVVVIFSALVGVSSPTRAVEA